MAKSKPRPVPPPEPASSGASDEEEEEVLPFPVDDDFLAAAHERVVEKMPDLEPLKPEVRAAPPHVLLLYKDTTSLPDGRSLKRVTRALFDEQGDVVKLSTSRG